MEFRQATQEDLAFVRQNPFEGAVKNYPYLEIPADNCCTAVHESEIIAVGGLVVKWDGVGMFWLMLTKDFKKAGGLTMFRAIKLYVDYLIRKNNLWRAEADIRCDFPEAIKMIEFLGFKRDCRREKYLPDKGDSYLYSRIL